MEILAWAVASIVLVIAAAVLTAEDAAIALLPRTRVRRLLEAERAGAAALDAMTEQPAKLRASASLVRASAIGASAALGWTAAGGLGVASPVAIVSLVGAIAALGVGFSLADGLPRSLAVQNPENVALAFARVAAPLSAVAYPFARALAAPWVFAVRLAGGERAEISPWADEDEFRAGGTGDEESIRDETEEAILDAVSEFTDKVVREVMVPRTDMTALPDTATLDDAIDAIGRHGYSRLPVYHDTIDDVRGVLYAKDILAHLRDSDRGAPIGSLSRAPYFVPETKPIDELFIEMRNKTHIAIVADEYGGTAGLVTIEDLLEELVGEIFDEYDREERLVESLGEGRYRIDARLPVGDVNELFGTEIEVEADTIVGVASALAGHIPAVGERVEIEGLRLTVLEREGTRVRLLEVESVRPLDEEESSDA